MKKVIILRGVSGSGKSTIAQMLCSMEPEFTAYICSADKYFYKNDEYKFDVTKLENAHKVCYADFVNVLTLAQFEEIQTIIVDNTNLSNWEMAPYIAFAQYCNAEIEIMEVDSGLSAGELTIRNVHGVSHTSIAHQMARYERLLPHWKKYLIKED